MSVSSITTLSEEHSEVLYSFDNYFVRTDVEPGEVIIKNGCAPPINTDRYFGGYKITYMAGYGDAEDVPQEIKAGLWEWVVFALENRVITRDPPEMARPLLGGKRILKV